MIVVRLLPSDLFPQFFHLKLYPNANEMLVTSQHDDHMQMQGYIDDYDIETKEVADVDNLFLKPKVLKSDLLISNYGIQLSRSLLNVVCVGALITHISGNQMRTTSKCRVSFSRAAVMRVSCWQITCKILALVAVPLLFIQL